MAKIPSVASLGERQFSGTRKVITPDTSFVGTGMKALGAAAQNVGDTLGDIHDKRTDFDVAEAEANFLIDKQKQDRAYDHDQDYETIPERYGKSMDDSLNRHAESIRDNRKKAAFLNRNTVKVESGKGRMGELAFGRERDIKRGRMNDMLNDLRDGFLNDDPNNAGQWIEAGDNLFASAQFQDFYGAEEAAKVKEAWKNDAAKAKLNSMEPESALEAMNQSWVEKLPVDDQIALKNFFEEKLIYKKSVNWVDDNYTGDVEDTRAGIASIDDEKLRKATEDRFAQVLNTEKRDYSQEQTELYDSWGKDVIDRKVSTNDIPDKVRDKMSTGMWANLTNIEKAAHQPPAYTPLNVKLALLQHKKMAEKTGNWKPLVSYYQSNSGRLSRSDQGAWGKITIDGLNPEVESPLTFQQKIVSNFGTQTAEQKQEMLNAYEQWSISEQSAGRPINDEKIDGWMKDRAAKTAYRTGVAGFFEGEASLFELEGEDRATREEAITQLRLTGTDAPTPDQIGDTHQAIKIIKNSFAETRKGVHKYMLANEIEFNKDNAETYTEAYNRAYMIARQGGAKSPVALDAAIKIILKEQGL